jgi:hypothetical protein
LLPSGLSNKHNPSAQKSNEITIKPSKIPIAKNKPFAEAPGQLVVSTSVSKLMYRIDPQTSKIKQMTVPSSPHKTPLHGQYAYNLNLHVACNLL